MLPTRPSRGPERGSATLENIGMPKRVVLLGHPVGHSLSGALQQAAFESLSIDATYEPHESPSYTAE